ncbi:PREDICTED: RING finger and transmembrane domain-containing protein 2 [Nicrophorus vespilloides]|uniref:RING finger and transmembrane domain-containing protein 2 n=1 Tax=Nicrophorus vespilloides TaxID=110193 RepID=A0ABM1N9T6_NICVS|nr:PREDICTED: RING finger and transmembrane domain-containing protein 2 [Nicrophorus vespilloides]
MDNQQPASLESPIFLRSQSTEGTNNLPLNAVPLSRSTSLTTNSLARANFQRRTFEGARQLRDNLQNVMREIQPLVETAAAVNITSFLNRPQSEPNMQNAANNSIMINVDVPDIPEPAPVNANNQAEEPPENNVNNEVEDEENNIEGQQAISILQKYVPYLLILLAKCLYDHHEGILNGIILYIMFTYANSTVVKEATKRGFRNITKLLWTLLYIILGIVSFHVLIDKERLYLNLVFVNSYKSPLKVWDLLWFVGITDFILKLITVAVKVILTLMPEVVVAFQKRGKVYLLIEAISQMYRSLATIQPWLFYLLDSYQGTEKIVGAFLTAAYMVSKGTDLLFKSKLLKTALYKLLQNVTVGCSPSKEQIQTAGEHCPICHDEYDSPVLLQCRHIFCENCVTTWFDREQTCPLCRCKIVDDPSWRDGSTSYFIQLF